MSEVTISGGGLKDALTIKVSNEGASATPDRLHEAMTKMLELQKKNTLPKDREGRIMTRSATEPYTG
jgi:hypothetical protein